MLEEITIISVLVHFFWLLLAKWGFWQWLMQYGARNNRIIYDLAHCVFCRSFHLTWIICFWYGFFNGFYWGLVIVSLGATALFNIIHGLLYQRS